MDAKSIDKNLLVETNVDTQDLHFYDVRKAPFRVYGLYDYKNEPEFKRMPDEAAKAVSDEVATLARCTAGGRVRFSTTSRHIAIRALMPSVSHYPHMPLSGGSGFDLFVEEPVFRLYRHAKTFIPPLGMKNGYVSRFEFPDCRLRYITIHFPSYNPLISLEIGLDKDAALGEGLDYRSELPIVYYGSSITQGGCASRPGNTYQCIVSRRLNMDHINLGFSGNGCGEDNIVEYMATLPMSAFVSDYDHNAPNPTHLKNTHCKMYQKIREKNPDVPYIMLSRPDFDTNYDESILRRDVIYDTYRFAREQGDRNVYYIDGKSIFQGKYTDMCTVDGCHPTDLGFALMADHIEAELQRAMTQHLFD